MLVWHHEGINCSKEGFQKNHGSHLHVILMLIFTYGTTTILILNTTVSSNFLLHILFIKHKTQMMNGLFKRDINCHCNEKIFLIIHFHVLSCTLWVKEIIQTLSTMYLRATHRIIVFSNYLYPTRSETVKHVLKTTSMQWYNNSILPYLLGMWTHYEQQRLNFYGVLRNEQDGIKSETRKMGKC
jgi:hypothetical protein